MASSFKGFLEITLIQLPDRNLDATELFPDRRHRVCGGGGPGEPIVPEGHAVIAQRFNVGNRPRNDNKSRRDG